MNDTVLARRIFRAAAIYGFVVLPPMLLSPLPDKRPELLFGFVGLALTFQALFLAIARDPVRFRPMMKFGIAEKLAFGTPALALVLLGKTAPLVAVFAAIDLALAFAFWVALRNTPLQQPA